MTRVSVFHNQQLIAQGHPEEVARHLSHLSPPVRSADLIAFDDETGRQVELSLRPLESPPRRARGRPSLGVTPREVTLLPVHWDWLGRQPGGTSAALRRLVDGEMRKGVAERERIDAAYRFLTVMAGDLGNFEEAVRELYAGSRAGYDRYSHGWPLAIRDHGRKLAWPDS